MSVFLLSLVIFPSSIAQYAKGAGALFARSPVLSAGVVPGHRAQRCHLWTRRGAVWLQVLADDDDEEEEDEEDEDEYDEDEDEDDDDDDDDDDDPISLVLLSGGAISWGFWMANLFGNAPKPGDLLANLGR